MLTTTPAPRPSFDVLLPPARLRQQAMAFGNHRVDSYPADQRARYLVRSRSCSRAIKPLDGEPDARLGAIRLSGKRQHDFPWPRVLVGPASAMLRRLHRSNRSHLAMPCHRNDTSFPLIPTRHWISGNGVSLTGRYLIRKLGSWR